MSSWNVRTFASRFILSAVLATAASGAASAGDIPKTPEAGAIKIGIEPWLGYGQWHIAAKKGLFAKNGLSEVSIVNFTQDKDINAALASGDLDAANIATHTAIAMASAGLPIKIVALLDFSLTADAVLAGKDIKSIADLKGKEVAYEEGTTSDLLINYALKSNGMSIADIKKVPMPASDAGGALIAGKVPVAVTYEPYITAAKAQDKDIKLLFAAGVDPGLISDVFVVREDFLKKKPGQVRALLESWDAALKDYKADTPGGRKIIAEAVGDTAENLATAFDGVQYYSIAENKKALGGDFASKTYDDVTAAAKVAGIFEKGVPAKDLIDPSFVQSAE